MTMVEKVKLVDEFVNKLNWIPTSAVEIVMKSEWEDGWEEISYPFEGAIVNSSEFVGVGEVLEIKDNNDGEEVAIVADDSGRLHEVAPLDLRVAFECYDSDIPMNGTMWSFKMEYQKRWAETHLKEFTEIGFRIFRSDSLGMIFGIDAYGYDLKAAHFEPLYDAIETDLALRRAGL